MQHSNVFYNVELFYRDFFSNAMKYDNVHMLLFYVSSCNVVNFILGFIKKLCIVKQFQMHNMQEICCKN